MIVSKGSNPPRVALWLPEAWLRASLLSLEIVARSQPALVAPSSAWRLTLAVWARANRSLFNDESNDGVQEPQLAATVQQGDGLVGRRLG